MRDAADPVAIVHGAVTDALTGYGTLVLAVSGGLDSMVLLDAIAAVAPARVARVATYDHGTGIAARRATAVVARRARAAGLPLLIGRADRALHGESEWREARWAFLRACASDLGATVVTAHTDDDQLETVTMRILRGAGARGLAGLYAPGAALRPFIGLSRALLERYARARGVRWVVDPSNASRDHLRNRVRLDLLPALRRARPEIDDELRSIARRAAGWRAEVDRALESVPARLTAAGTLRVAAAEFDGYDREALGVAWPALAAQVGARLDRRGTRRLAEFTMSCTRGRVPLSGGWEVARTRDTMVLRRRTSTLNGEQPLVGRVEVGRFQFHPVPESSIDDPWAAALPGDVPVVVRAWRAGDRMRARSASAPRRVKRFLGDAGIAGPERVGWPVVVAAGEIVWIPGVRRSDAATVRPGRPAVHYQCDRLDR